MPPRSERQIALSLSLSHTHALSFPRWRHYHHYFPAGTADVYAAAAARRPIPLVNEFAVDSSLNKPRLECLDENWKRVKFDFWTCFEIKTILTFFGRMTLSRTKNSPGTDLTKKSSAVE